MAIKDQRKQVSRKPTAQQIGDIANRVLKLPPQNTIILDRLIEAAGSIVEDEPEVTFQHTILCQTSLPYRNPGPDVRRWQRQQGSAMLVVDAGSSLHPEQGEIIDLPLPWGPKARLVLMHLNREAIRTQSPEIEVGNSLTDFVGRLGLVSKGQNMRLIKSQLAALSAATIRMAFSRDHRAFQVDTKVVSAFDLWFSKDERQRVLWPSVVRLSLDYFESLMRHAVPLEEKAIGALSHSAMALDLYAWLAQRLHRIRKQDRQMIAWPLLQEQFGPEYERLRKFREKFIGSLKQVAAVYPSAKIDVTDKGLTLYHSPPPIAKLGYVIKLLTDNKG